MITLDPRSEQAVAEEIKQAASERVRALIIRTLMLAGEKAVNQARLIVTSEGAAGAGRPYKVQTGNLVSSVGYCIVEDGNIITMSSFQSIAGETGSGAQGSATGKQYAKQVASEFPFGYALILVAGMHYASYVQEIHNRDVLASATLVAEKLVNELKTKLSR